MRLLTTVLALLVAGAATTAAHAATTSTPATHTHHATSTMHPAVTLDSAIAIAKAKVPTGKIKSHELEREKGHLIYSFDFAVPGKSGIDEVNVDAMSGAVLAVAHEGPKAERLEKLQEKREARKTTTPH